MPSNLQNPIEVEKTIYEKAKSGVSFAAFVEEVLFGIIILFARARPLHTVYY